MTMTEERKQFMETATKMLNNLEKYIEENRKDKTQNE